MKYKAISVVCVLFAAWFIYALSIGPDAGDPIGMSLSGALAAFLLSIALVPKLTLTAKSFDAVWSDGLRARIATVLFAAGFVVGLVGFWLWAVSS